MGAIGSENSTACMAPGPHTHLWGPPRTLCGGGHQSRRPPTPPCFCGRRDRSESRAGHGAGPPPGQPAMRATSPLG